MNKKQQRIFIVSLVVTICVTGLGLSACRAYASNIRGFGDSIFYMANADNIDSYTLITIGANTSRRVSYDEALNVPAERLGDDIKVCLEISTKTYDGAMELAVNWVGPKATENVMTLICFDDDLYISTNIFKLFARLTGDVMPETANLFDEVYKYEYLKLSNSDIALITGLNMKNDINTTKAATNIAAKFKKVFADSSTIAISNKLSDALTINRGTYYLELNAKTAAELFEMFIKASSNNTSGFEELITTIETEFGLSKGEILRGLGAGSVKELLESLAAANKSVIPDMNISASVKASGEGNDMRQEYAVDMANTENGKTTAVHIEGYTEINTKPIIVPSVNVGTTSNVMIVMMGGINLDDILNNVDLNNLEIGVDDVDDIINSFNWGSFNFDGLDISGFNID